MPADLQVELRRLGGEIVLSYRPVDRTKLRRERDVAAEPPEPKEVSSADELFFTGEHLELYRHPTRAPEPYWEEAISRDPHDFRCNTALGKRSLQRGQFQKARDHLQNAIQRITRQHPNPVSGEAHYHLGIACRWLGDEDAAYRALFKTAWNNEWRSSAHYQLATIDCQRGDWAAAWDHLEASLETNRHHNKAHVLQALDASPWEGEVASSRRSDFDPTFSTPFCQSIRSTTGPGTCMTLTDEKSGEAMNECFLSVTRNDAQTILDLVFDYIEAGFYELAIDLLHLHHANEIRPVAVPNPLERTSMTRYVLAWLKRKQRPPTRAKHLRWPAHKRQTTSSLRVSRRWLSFSGHLIKPARTRRRLRPRQLPI